MVCLSFGLVTPMPQFPPAELHRRMAQLIRVVRRARMSPDVFAEFAFTDSAGALIRQSQVHRELQAFLSAHDRALIELPRDHGKSMQVCVRILWELGLRPSLRVKIVCASEALAAERGRFLRDSLASNSRLRLVFPALRPATPWTPTRFHVERPAEVIGPSVTALGIGAASTGTRADLLVCDDIVDVRAIRSQADRERVKLYYRENLVNLLEPQGRLWNIFTPWHHADLNAELKRHPSYALFRRAIGNDEDELAPVWPEHWPRQRLVERRREIGEIAFARGYRLLCVPDEAMVIPAKSIQFWTTPQEYSLIVLAVDPAISTRQTADASALVTLGRTADRVVHCLEAVARRVTAPQLAELISEADRRWQPGVILLESNAGFGGLRDLFIAQAPFGAKIRSINQVQDKGARVRLFSVPVENGYFRLHGDGQQVAPGQQELFDEMIAFPVGEHDDLLDAAAFGTAYLLQQNEPRIILPGE